MHALEALLADLPDDHHVSVAVAPLNGPLTYAHDADRVHYAASTMKTWLVMAVYAAAEHGGPGLDTFVTVHDDFASATDGSVFRMAQEYDNDDEVWRRVGDQVTLRWLCLRAIVLSSNLATNLLLEQVRMHDVTAVLTSIGAQGSRVHRGIEDAVAREAGLNNTVTAADLVRTYQALANSSVLPAEASAEVLAMHEANQSFFGLPPAFAATAVIAHKSGWVDGATHDAGIIRCPGHESDIVAVCTTTPDAVDGQALVQRVATAVAQDTGRARLPQQ